MPERYDPHRCERSEPECDNPSGEEASETKVKDSSHSPDFEGPGGGIEGGGGTSLPDPAASHAAHPGGIGGGGNGGSLP